jgi:hypothetical protein
MLVDDYSNMTKDDAKKILEVTLAHADGYRKSFQPSPNEFATKEDRAIAEKCATAASNTGWQILRSFGYSHEQIMEMKAELTRE